MKHILPLLLLGGASVFALSDPGGERTIKLHGELAFKPAGSVTAYGVTGDNLRTVFLAESETGVELMSAPVDGSAGQIMLNAPLVAGGAVTEFALTPDGSQAVYRADQEIENQYELFVVPVDGSQAPTKLSGALGSDRDVRPGIELTPDGARAIYRADADADQVNELFSVPVDGSAPPVKLNVDGDFINGDFKFTPDSTRVVFRTGSSVSIVPVDGSAPSVPLTSLGNINAMQLSSDSTRAVYRTTRTAGVDEVFSLLLDGSAPETRLNDPLVQAGDVHGFALSSDASRVVYLADQDVDTVAELYSVPIGGGTVDKLNAPIDPTQSGVSYFEIAPNSMEVAFKVRQDDMVRNALFSAPIDGSTSAVQLTGSLTQEEDPQISRDSSRVLYSAYDNGYRLYSVPMDASAAPVEISAPLGPLEGILFFHQPEVGTEIVYEVYRRLLRVPFDGSAPAVEIARIPDEISGEFEQVRFSPDASRVVFLADAEINNLLQVYSVPLDASSPYVPLSDPLYAIEAGTVGSYAVSPDGRRAVYLASGEEFLTQEIYSVLLDGSAPPVKLNPDPVQYGDVRHFAISPDSRWVVYQADQDEDEVAELFTVPIDGSLPAVKLNEPLPPDADVGLWCTCHGTYFSVSPDSSRVIFFINQYPPGTVRIWSAPIDASTSAVPMSPPSQVPGSIPYWVFSPDSSLVAYTLEQDTSDVPEVYTVPLDGSATPVKLNPPLPAGRHAFVAGFSPDSSTVVYSSDQAVDGQVELYSVPADASAPETRLSAINTANGDVREVQISVGGRVVYRADQQVNDRDELYSVELDGTNRVRLNDLPISGGDVTAVEITPDGTGVVFFGDVRINDLGELFHAPIDTAGAQVRISANIAEFGGIRDWAISPDSSRVVYNGDVEQDTWWRLYSVPTTGGPVTRINGPLIFPGDVQASFRISSDSSYVLYRADQEVNERMDLYAVPIDGRASAPFSLKANGQQFDDALQFELSDDSMRVVYSAEHVASFRPALFRTDLVPRATAVGPALGPAVGGNTVTIRGCGFTDEAEVLFDGNPATDVTFVNASELRVTVPASRGLPAPQTGPPGNRLRRAVIPRLEVAVEVSTAGIGTTLDAAYTYVPATRRRLP